MIIDCHMHVWPDHIADAMQSQRPSGMPLRYDGKVSGVLRTMDELGIDLGLALGVGIKASVVARTNEFIGTVPRDRRGGPDVAQVDGLIVGLIRVVKRRLAGGRTPGRAEHQPCFERLELRARRRAPSPT